MQTRKLNRAYATLLALFATSAWSQTGPDFTRPPRPPIVPTKLANPEARTAVNPTFTTFNAPGAGTGARQGTFAYQINNERFIVGQYTDAGTVNHGYVRAPDGDITTFEAPGAGTLANQGTTPNGIDTTGAVEGYYLDGNTAFHGFLRAADGTITTFDASGAGTGAYQGTLGADINTAGTVAGYYYNAEAVSRGLVRAASGAVTRFDAPGAGTGTGQGTSAFSINTAGVITGAYLDANLAWHGFLRAASGAMTTFDAPGAGVGSFQGTRPWISRVVIPRAYIDRILSSKPSHRVWCFFTICGSKLPLRSRGVSISNSPKSPFSVLEVVPFLEFPLLYPAGSLFSYPR